jgi:hypothetical protein
MYFVDGVSRKLVIRPRALHALETPEKVVKYLGLLIWESRAILDGLKSPMVVDDVARSDRDEAMTPN